MYTRLFLAGVRTAGRHSGSSPQVPERQARPLAPPPPHYPQVPARPRALHRTGDLAVARIAQCTLGFGGRGGWQATCDTSSAWACGLRVIWGVG
ncbi:hypothetical protein HispidOSU_018194 [Sigmodon hispidus]